MVVKIKKRGQRASSFVADFGLLQNLTGIQYHLNNRNLAWHPPADLFETEKEFMVQVEIAGMMEEDFSITFTRDRLFINGNRKESQRRVGYHQMEIAYGEFESEIPLPRSVDTEAIQAKYENGFLLVVMPKRKSHKITVKEG